ncbi:hypothetical protein [Aequorivita xiaoshiensis]|uniref:YD repeat-containing protein n=1 Tax=Aequorivita xiaoshiensis TaxID=2874476 RepID=A0A9X1R2M5_9FLAO|nr:hypothetical protein [Aequorivita xiaoshiensis]MCG2430742.1 hypothetical protein [Aequorivita xiaoshiensis]
MIRKLFILAMCFSVLACSDDENQQDDDQITFKIKKLTKTFYEENGTSQAYKLEYLYDESGKRRKVLSESFLNGQKTQQDFSYNERNQILESKTTDITQNRVIRTVSYLYNNSNKISTVKFESSDGSVITSNFTYINNSVFIEDNIGANKELIFNDAGKLLKTITFISNPVPNTITETINYSGNLITSINYEYSRGSITSQEYIYEYDNKTNPFYEHFNENISNFIYNFTGTMKSYKTEFSAKNFTKVTYTSSVAVSDYTDVFTTKYNEQGFPTNAEVKRNGVLFEELTYEYY